MNDSSRRVFASERGSSLVWVLLAVTIIGGLIAAGSQNLITSDRVVSREFTLHGQALNVSRAGLVDAFAWFRRQQVQPVLDFLPRRDLEAVPKVNETIDPSIGLVREFPIGGNLWGRYEVRLADPTEPDDEKNRLPVRDVSAERAVAGQGGVWLVRSWGFVYRKLSNTAAWNEAPNDPVASAVTATELRRLTIVPPANAALCVSRGDSCTIGNRGKLDGGEGSALVWPLSTGLPSIQGEILGQRTSLIAYDDSVPAVFGISRQDLESYADIRVSSVDGLPPELPEYGLVLVEGNAVFDAARPLRGTGILVVSGNLTIAAGSNSFFNGLLYVEGNVTIQAPSLVRGIVVARGTCSVSGVGDYAEIDYDAAIIDQLLVYMGQYRFSRAIYFPRQN